MAVVLIWISIVMVEYFSNNIYNICWLTFPLYGLEIIGAICGIAVTLSISNFLLNKGISLSKVFKILGRNSIWILCVHAVDIEVCPWHGSIINICRCIVDVSIAILIKEGWIKLKDRVRNF